jgi:regulator of protease activity HflC (stomatin/prohibitin superfamily)
MKTPAKTIWSKEPGQSVVGFALGAVAILIVIFTLFWWLNAWRNVDPGNVGVKINRTTGEITIVRTIGWVSIDPSRETFVEYPAIDQTVEQVGESRVNGRSSEGQLLGIDNALQFRLTSDDEALKNLIRSFGGAGMDTIISRVVVPTQREAVSSNAALYGWEDAFSAKRVELAEKIQFDISRQLSARGIEVIDFNIRDIDLPDALDAFINNKIEAQQRVDQARYELEQSEVNAKQKAVEAQAEADARLIRARAEAEANRLIAQSLNDTLVRYQQTLKWDGKLPAVTGGATPIINLPNFVADAP